MRLLASVDFDNLVLIDIFEDVRSVHEDADRSDCGHDEKDVQLQTIHDHRDELPVFSDLRGARNDLHAKKGQ